MWWKGSHTVQSLYRTFWKCSGEFSWLRENLCHQKAAGSRCWQPPFASEKERGYVWRNSGGDEAEPWDSANEAIFQLSCQQQAKLILSTAVRMWEVQFTLSSHSPPAPNVCPVCFSPVLIIIQSFLGLTLCFDLVISLGTLCSCK